MAMIRVQDELLTRKQVIENAAAYLMEQTRDWQLIREFLCNRAEEISLTKKQQEKLERYQFIYNQQVSGRYTTAQIVNMVMRQFDGVKQRQAYDDIRATHEIFTSVININKLFELSILIEQTKQMIADCRKDGDQKTAAAHVRNLKDLLAMLPDKEENPADAFEGHIIEPVFDPRLIGAPDIDLKEVLKAINEKRDVKLNLEQITTLTFEDIENEQDPAAL